MRLKILGLVIVAFILLALGSNVAAAARATPATPAKPAKPADPATPAQPNPGQGPATPAIPATPATPATPASPARGRSSQAYEVVYSVSIYIAPETQEVVVGGTVAFSVTVANLGNRSDTITLSVYGVPNGWSASLASNVVNIEAGQSTTVALDAAPALNAPDGSYAVINVTAICGDGITAATDTFTLTARVPVDIPVEVPVDNPTGVQRLQLTFVVDISGSMWYKEFGYDATIERFMTDLVNALETEGIVVEYSLVTYGSYDYKPRIELGFTGDAEIVKSKIHGLSQRIGGGIECMYWAALTGLQQNWDTSDSTVKTMIIMTDEDADDKYGYSSITSSNVINTANQQDVTIYGVDCSADESWGGYYWTATKDLNTLANGTGGQVFTEKTMYELIGQIISMFLPT